MRTDLLELAETESDDPEFVPEILPVDARLSVRGPVAIFQSLFDRAAVVTPVKEIISGTGHALFEAIPAGPGHTAYVRITATDGSMTLSMVADGVEVLMPGAVLIPGKKISEILKAAPTTTARIEILGNTATVRSGRALWEVQTPVGDALPPSADVSGVTMHSLPVQALLDALVVTKKAASTSPARASLMQLSIEGGAITGIDGGRLHRQVVEGLPKDLVLTIPLRAADEAIHLLKTTSAEAVELGGNSSHLRILVGEQEIIAQRELVGFPDISSQVLGPALSNIHTLSMSREDLLGAIKRVRISADPDYPAIFITLVPGKSSTGAKMWSITVSARDRSGNSAQESIDVMWVGPSARRSLCVNHKYLTDLLTTITDEQALFKIGDDTKAVRMPMLIENSVTGFTGWVAQVRAGYI